MSAEHTPHSTPTLNQRKDEIVREWREASDEIGHFAALDGLATAFVAMERQWERTQEQLEVVERERDEARATMLRVFACDPDESGGYDTSDPKHPAYHSTHADIWDAREGK